MSCSLGLAYFIPTARALVKLQSTMGPAHPTQKAHIFLCRWAGILWFQESPCNVSEMDNKSRSCGSMWSGCRVIPGMRLPLWNGEGTYKLTKGLQGLKSPLVVRSQELPAECCPETWSLGAARTGCYGEAIAEGPLRPSTTERQQPLWSLLQDKTNVPPAETRLIFQESAFPTCGCRQPSSPWLLSVLCSSADWSWVGLGCSSMSCEDHCPSP